MKTFLTKVEVQNTPANNNVESLESYTSKSSAIAAALKLVSSKRIPFAKYKGIIACRNSKKSPYFGYLQPEFSKKHETAECNRDGGTHRAAMQCSINSPCLPKGKFLGMAVSKPVHPYELPRILNINWTHWCWR
jgi:hypothetical protein